MSHHRDLLGASTRLLKPELDDEELSHTVVDPGKRTAVDGDVCRVGTAPVPPGKQTRIDRDGAWAPADALAYASWMLEQARGRWFDRRAEPGGAEVDDGTLATAFGFLDEIRGGERLPDELARQLVHELGADLSSVRVHTGDHAARTAAALRARAVTIGDDIYFAAGAYDPTSEAGIELIAHEVTHVVQNRRNGRIGERLVSRPDDVHERQADDFAARFAEVVRRAKQGPELETFGTRGPVDVLQMMSEDRSERGLMTAGLTIAERATRPALPSVMGDSAPLDPVAAKQQAADRRAATLYRRVEAAKEFRADDPAVAAALEHIGRGQPLPAAVRLEMEADFGVSLARVRVHTDQVAAAAAGALRAEAFTIGEDIFFAEHAFAPDSHAGRRLLAHELTHVVQAQQGRTETNGGELVSQPDEPLEREADAVAERLDDGSARPDRRMGAEPAERGPMSLAPSKIHRYPGSGAAGRTDPNALIPVADLIRYIETMERAYPDDQPSDIITRIRVQYYNGFAFEQLIPRAHTHDLVSAWYPDSPMPGVATVPRTISGMRYGSAAERDAHTHLTAHADENARGDNPSPYIVMPDGSRIDLGHMLLGLDALIHPRTASPFTDYGISNIDPSSFVADLALASVWTTQHAEEGAPRSGAPHAASGPTLNEYWTMSAPVEDLLGDVDSFGMHAEYAMSGGSTPLSQLMRQYYLSTAASAGVNRRWQTFCAGAGLRYTRGATITFDATTRASLVTRVNNMSDLVNTSTLDNVGTMVLGTTSRRSGGWPHTGAVVDRFLAYVGTNLQAELTRRP